VAKIITRVEAHYKDREAEDLSRVYSWCPENVVSGCDCPEKLTHPWRALNPYCAPTRGT
jgi:hypothetical protein